MSTPDRHRDGGVFTAGAACPHCGTCDVHPIRQPNPNAPRIVHQGTGEETIVRRFDGSVAVIDIDLDQHDRWDERPYDVIRTCTGCGWEWGQS